MLVQNDELILPETIRVEGIHALMPTDPFSMRCGARISAWLEDRATEIRRIWTTERLEQIEPLHGDSSAVVEQLLKILTHQEFNYQSRGRVAHLFPELRHRLKRAVAYCNSITFFLLFNGGYRGSPLPDSPELIFQPDQTELLLLFQIARLQRQVTRIYAPGIDFVIVVNNGVARWVNEIPRTATEAYIADLRAMIRQLGADAHVRVLVQSELTGYCDTWPGGSVTPSPSLSSAEHRLVERFLGRSCDADEARHRSALYPAAEAVWGEELLPLAEAQDAILLRQVAHPASLSFRPFPGGAIRTQNGTLGFAPRGADWIPQLITTRSFARHSIRRVPVTLPSALRRATPVDQVTVDA